MKKKKKSGEDDVWDESLNDFMELNKNSCSLTRDTIHGRLRPEPEIIENILEELENKIRHYFNLYQIEKEKRTCSDKNNYYLQKELYKAYATLDKNKLYTKKLEDKLNSIKENECNLIDTVRRIDLLYIQLDTLVQSFAGVCTQVIVEINENKDNVMNTIDIKRKKGETIKMLLDYIYPCRTLDPRLNSLYGMLYYQSIGLLKDESFVGPPIPPIPPVVPSESNGWLPPCGNNNNNKMMITSDNYVNILSDHRFSDLIRMVHSGQSAVINYPDIIKNMEDAEKVPHNENKNNININSNLNSNNINMNDKGSSYESLIVQDLTGFDVHIGIIEINCHMNDPKIVCVVRYDDESVNSAIQDVQRVSKPKSPDQVMSTGEYIFNVDNKIHLNKLPQKKTGDVPSFMIDIHDVNAKELLGVCSCSFINEKTLIKNSIWDIYSKKNNSTPDMIIGKIYVTISPYPSKSILPAQLFKNVKHTQYNTTGRMVSQGVVSKSNVDMSKKMNDIKISTKGKVGFQKSAVLSKVIVEKTPLESKMKTSAPIQRGKRVSFKTFSLKLESSGSKEKADNNTEEESKKQREKEENVADNNNRNVDDKKKEGDKNVEETNKISSTFSVKNFIKNFANKIESNKIEKENVSFTLKRKTENEEIKDDKNLTEENKVEKKEPEDENKNKDNIVKKEISKAKDGILKIKLPALAKKEPSIVTKEMAKSNSIEQKLDDEKKMISMGKSIEMKGKGLPASNENNNENKNDNNGNNNNSADGKGIIGKPKIPLPKIKMELKKENLNKILLNKTIAKTSTDETNMSNTKNEEGTKPKFSIFKKDTPLNKKEDSAKVSKFAKISKTVLNKNDMEQNKIAEGSKANDVAMKKETTAKGEIVSEKKKTSKGSMFSFFKLRHSKVENEGDTTKVGEVQKGVSETQKKEVGNKAIEKDVSKMIKLPIQKKEAPSITSQDSVESEELKSRIQEAKSKTLLIDKSKIISKLSKNVLVKKEIKKFVPKLKNFA
ncbi:hypothetical protein PFAG_04581 [Plasmodium falciparum Santa Lucia]|uniref:Uncharacterized protein n=5 Tax=Plasmodium falciparum TaxID=5833 RepID=A0A5K1K8U2_PLAF7|nr:conserved protein, unknown function [Plasmodium falciparum 3D7]ETW16923.1 hypothetical protein PFFVO_04188 [Plasmodium falciparum Vietnam Oak-Knoll (FVO)]ETW41121.1 hypothetical protein PFNF135_04755 [Plasmodium falciparum NF135/5.C10]EUT81368.1 hypothetical protein PFAG_04581 [Plasmodium falciparum Santa Lucia]KAF4327826.1 hypothetical protein CYL21_4028 [Plasmodium falciparum NF54]PKC47173.1 hypothetical protein CK202_2806 [Plasmodium falciparum NF54]|eukprot:XP_001350053.1 conserved Plasmodium protein, unknown function [Plasmodium falciparum 3D7]